MKHEPIAPPLPQNLDAERSVLGAILVDNQYLGTAQEVLVAGDFFNDHNRIIFAQMIAMGDAGKPIDMVTLCDELQREGKLEASAGHAYIATLSDSVPRVSNVDYYAKILKQKARRRQLIHAGHQLQHAAFDNEEDVDAILERTTATLAGIATQNKSGEDYRNIFHSYDEFTNSSGLTFAIEGFLQTGAATFIAGLSGHDKTNIMLSMVKASLSGKKLWNLFEVTERAVRCVYLIPESSIGPFKHRLELFGLMEFLLPDNERLLVRTLSKGPTPSLADPCILYAAKGADVYLDTAVRFAAEGSSENDANDMARGLSADIFALLSAGARLVVGAQHSPKSFVKETVMTLENILRGSGDIGAMLATCWGVRLLDEKQNVVYVQNCKPRDFEPCGPLQLIGRPYIDQEGDFRLHKRPGESGWLSEELNLGGNKGGAPAELREQRQQRIATVEEWLEENPSLTRKDVVAQFARQGVTVSYDAAKKYLSDTKKGRV